MALASNRKTGMWGARFALLTLICGISGLAHAQGGAAAMPRTNGVTVSVPNGYASVMVEDLSVRTTAGPVVWQRIWTGEEWKFNPQWESLSQSWKNLTGSQVADTTGVTATTTANGATGTSSGGPAALSSSGGAGGGSGGGCWVWVDEDWQPSFGTVMIGGLPQAEPMQPARLSPFNKVMGQDAATYAPLQRVNVDYASLCPGVGLTQAPVADLEAIRRSNELYLGEGGRFTFNNRTILEKRAVRQLPSREAATWYAQLGTGQVSVQTEANDKGYRWQDKAGDWIDYNTQGQVVAWGDRNSNPVWMARDGSGRLLGVVDAAGHVVYSLHYTGELLTEVRDHPTAGKANDLPARRVAFKYDDRNRLTEVTDARGFVTKYDYNPQNRLIKITDAEGRAEQLQYSGDTVVKRIAPDGGVTDYVFEFDDANKQFISKVTGPETAAGRRVEDYTHNRSGKLVRRLVNGRTEEEVRYDTGARVEIRSNARGFVTKVANNEFDQMVETVQTDGSTIRRSYSAQHLRLTEATDELGIKAQYQYDDRGNLLKKIEAVGKPEERVSEYVRNERGQVRQLIRRGRTQANGVVTPDVMWQIEYDAQGLISTTTDPLGHVRRYGHDRAGNLLSYIDPKGRAIQYEVDAQGHLLREMDALGHVLRYAYDKVGNLIAETDARGKAALTAYDAMNRSLQITNAVGGVAKVQYDALGFPIKEMDEDGREAIIDYDNFQRLVKQVDGKGNTTEHGYQLTDGTAGGMLGSLHQPTQIRYPTYTEQKRFDARERQTSQTLLNPTSGGVEGLLSSNKYDARGRIVETTDADGKTNYFAYDAFGRTTRFTNSLGQSIDLLWDVRGNLIQVKDAKGNATRFEYDGNGRLVKETLPLGQVTAYAYDAAGNRESVTDATGNITRYFYDAANRPVRTELVPGGSGNASQIFTFSHDDNDNLTGWSDGTRSAIYTYDDVQRKTSETLNYGNNVSLAYRYAYTPAGYLKSLTYPDGTQVGFSFDQHGQLASVEIPGEGSLSVSEWNWVAPRKLTLPGGIVREISHDGLLRMTGLKVKNAGQQIVFEIASQYGKRDEIQSKTVSDMSAGGSSTVSYRYGYDAEQHLTQVSRDSGGMLGQTTETFGFDAAGNRTTHSAVNGDLTFDANNRITKRGSGSDAIGYEYDANGNLIQATRGSGGAADSIRRYRYDVLNRLIEVLDGADASIARYEYDPFDNRIAKTLFRGAQGQVLAEPQRMHFLYGDAGVMAEADAQGRVMTQYGWKPDGNWSMDPIFIKTMVKPATSDEAPEMAYAYFHNDHLGTPLRATNKAGEVVWRAQHSSLGQATVAGDSRLTNNLRYAGQYHDSETGLHYNTRRYYDPVAGRYITADPIGVAGGWNLYDYANGDPVNQLDPRGEWVWVVINVAMTVYDLYTEYQTYKETGCFDWTRLIPVPKWVPRIKWIPKRFRKCLDPCGCLLGGGKRHSFPGDTLVHAQDEKGRAVLKPIASLKPGEKVLAKSEWKPETDSLAYEPILDVHTTPGQTRTMVHLTLDDGQTVTATDGHPFKTTEGWRDAILLKRGGKLLLKGGDADAEQAIGIADVGLSTQTLTTYNLDVANAHTFFVGEEGVLVHNGKGGTPGNNQAQNKQFKYACQVIGKKRGKPLDKSEQRRLHDEITGRDMSGQEIIEEGISMFCCGD